MAIQSSPFQHCCAAESAYGLRAPDCACVFFTALLGTEWALQWLASCWTQTRTQTDEKTNSLTHQCQLNMKKISDFKRRSHWLIKRQKKSGENRAILFSHSILDSCSSKATLFWVTAAIPCHPLWLYHCTSWFIKGGKTTYSRVPRATASEITHNSLSHRCSNHISKIPEWSPHTLPFAY